MPILGSSAYNTVEDVLNRIRVILDDSEVAGGDILTDTAPFSIELVNAGYERVQLELATNGGETYANTVWLIGLPSVPIIDPEARLIVDDTGANIIYPNGVGNVFANSPQLPPDLIVPLTLWERQTGTNIPLGEPMHQGGQDLQSWNQETYLIEWIWINDGLRFRGATQVQDVKMRYEKRLPKVVTVNDPVPIRGVTNAAAYFSAMIFAESRGGLNAPKAEQHAKEEIFLRVQMTARRRQHKPRRRQPYSGRGGVNGFQNI